MESSSSQRIAGIKQYLRQNANSAGKTVGQLRAEEEGRIKLLKPPADATYAKVTIAGLPAEWVRDASVPAEVEETVLYFHGGGFVTGSCAVYRELAARVSKAGRVKVLVVEYRLAPEYKWPAAHDDCLSVYRALLAQGIVPEKLALGGDSIGGTLVLTSLLALRDAHENLPAAAFLMSPHTDLVDLDGETYTSNADSDPTGSRESTQMCLNWLLDTPIDPPTILAPWKLNLEELPHLLIQVGSDEVLLSDATRLAMQARTVGVQVTLEVYDQMWHVFQILAGMLPEAQQAIDRIGSFLQENLVK